MENTSETVASAITDKADGDATKNGALTRIVRAAYKKHGRGRLMQQAIALAFGS